MLASSLVVFVGKAFSERGNEWIGNCIYPWVDRLVLWKKQMAIIIWLENRKAWLENLTRKPKRSFRSSSLSLGRGAQDLF